MAKYRDRSSEWVIARKILRYEGSQVGENEPTYVYMGQTSKKGNRRYITPPQELVVSTYENYTHVLSYGQT